MALGMERAGFSPLLVNDNNRDAVATLRSNRPGWPVDHRDVQEVDFRGLRGAADVVLGGFPCQPFSTAGNQQGFSDARGMLAFELVRAIREARPRVAVGENVRGLVRHDGGRTLHRLLHAIRLAGYQVGYAVLGSQRFDVPQKRERLVILAVRRDVAAPIAFPVGKDPTLTVRHAIGDRPMGPGRQYPEHKRRIMALVPEGGNWRSLPRALQVQYGGAKVGKGGGTSGVARRLAWDALSPTLLCSPDQKRTELCHPSEDRPLNVREYARIQTFPDDWEFKGTVAAQYRQIGNAVPVNLAYHLGRAVEAILRWPSSTDPTNA
jgi:DNA (cytosine-5)-methyltransferase 1